MVVYNFVKALMYLFFLVSLTLMTYREVKQMNLNCQSGLQEINWTLNQGKLW